MRLSVKVQPGARREEVVGFEGDVLRVRVIAPPDKGKANEAVVALLAKMLGVAKRDVTLVRGAGNRQKVIEVTGLSGAEMRRRLGQPVPNDPANYLEHDDRRQRR
ncbi:MAG: YggU family protein [Chloroflexi bacterium]|nr:YggU family protein [Chloroflexota bacterium]